METVTGLTGTDGKSKLSLRLLVSKSLFVESKLMGSMSWVQVGWKDWVGDV